mmetsp:Transcript_16879/g.43021  ORF Transcript_16879/g.43021 Transcript_16879/m.43021 type:complete len:235 (+) Transcript_16879:194-898(+)
MGHCLFVRYVCRHVACNDCSCVACRQYAYRRHQTRRNYLAYYGSFLGGNCCNRHQREQRTRRRIADQHGFERQSLLRELGRIHYINCVVGELSQGNLRRGCGRSSPQSLRASQLVGRPLGVRFHCLGIQCTCVQRRLRWQLGKFARVLQANQVRHCQRDYPLLFLDCDCRYEAHDVFGTLCGRICDFYFPRCTQCLWRRLRHVGKRSWKSDWQSLLRLLDLLHEFSLPGRRNFQ